MAKSKATLVFTVDGVEYKVGKSPYPRIKWNQLYTTLTVLKDCVVDETLRLKLDTFLGTSAPIIHEHLWEIFQDTTQDSSSKRPKVRTCLWVIACYGYIRGIPIPQDAEKNSKWPKPSTIKRTRRRVIHDYKEDLKCPICQRPYNPPKNYKNKDAILRHFGGWLEKHLQEPH